MDLNKALLLVISAINLFASIGCESTPLPLPPVSPDFNVEQYREIAVIVDAEAAPTSLQATVFEQIFAQSNESLLRKGYRVSSRNDIAIAEREMQLRRTGRAIARAPMEDRFAKWGRVLAVPGVIVATPTTFSVERVRTEDGSYYRAWAEVSVRLLDVETSTIMWQDISTGTDFASNSRDIGSAFRNATSRALSSLPPLYPKMLIRTKPEGAIVFYNNTAVGHTPVWVQFRSRDLTAIELRHPGFQDTFRELVPTDNGEIRIKLEKLDD